MLKINFPHLALPLFMLFTLMIQMYHVNLLQQSCEVNAEYLEQIELILLEVMN